MATNSITASQGRYKAHPCPKCQVVHKGKGPYCSKVCSNSDRDDEYKEKMRQRSLQIVLRIDRSLCWRGLHKLLFQFFNLLHLLQGTGIQCRVHNDKKYDSREAQKLRALALPSELHAKAAILHDKITRLNC